MGSFKNEKNALTLVQSLKAKGFDSIIDNYEKNSELYYRVLLAEGYEDRNEARSKIKEIEKNPDIKKLKIAGIWICTGSDKLKESKNEKAPEETKAAKPAEKAKSPVDVTKDLVIEDTSKTTATVDAKNIQKAKTTTAETKTTAKKSTESDSKKASENKKASGSKKTASSKKAEDKKTDDKKTEAVSTAPKVKEVESTDKKAAESKENELIAQELPPIEEEDLKLDLVAQAKKIEKEIAEKNKKAEEKTEEASLTEASEEGDKIETSEAKAVAEEEAPLPQTSEEVKEEAEAETEDVYTETEEADTETEEAERESEASEEEAKTDTEIDELPSISLAIDAAAAASLKVNYAEDLLFSEEKPYTVFVRSYRDEKRALYDKNRLALFNYQGSIVKTYSKAKGYFFNLYAGAFESQEEAEELAEAMKITGIEATEIQNYNTIYSSIKKYNDYVLNNTITPFSMENTKAPESLSKELQACIRYFPLNEDYEIEELIAYDFNTIKAEELEDEYIQDLDNFIYQKENVNAAITCILNDSLFENNLTVYIQKGSSFTPDGIKTETTRKITVGIEDYDGFISEEEGIYTFTGLNQDGDTLIKIVADNLTQVLFNNYLTTIFDENALYENTSFKNAICSIAKGSTEEERRFVYFVTAAINENDALEDFGAYAKVFAGNSWTWSYFIQKDEIIEVMSTNIIYDKLAAEYYEAFTNNQMELDISEKNRPSFVPFVDSWYFQNEESSELFALVKAYIITANASTSLSERDLVYFIEDTELLKH